MSPLSSQFSKPVHLVTFLSPNMFYNGTCGAIKECIIYTQAATRILSALEGLGDERTSKDKLFCRSDIMLIMFES
jgi:hypothetical protein